MAWVIKILLAVLIRTVHTDQHILTEGDNFIFDIPNDVDYCLIFRLSVEGKLWNTSDPLENSTLFSELGDRLELMNQADQNFKINSLTQSDGDQYRMECWNDGRMSEKVADLLVCRDSEETTLHANPGETVKLQCEGTKDGDNMTVRWSHEDQRQNRRIQLSEDSSSLLIIYTILEGVDYFYYTCVVLEGQLCLFKNDFILFPKVQYVAFSVGEKAVLPCYNHDNQTEVRWRVGYIMHLQNNTAGRENQMYVSDGRTSGNYSLVIPSLMLIHSDDYVCYDMTEKRHNIKSFELLVCPKRDPLTEFFSEGEEVVLSCISNLTESERVVWYRQTAQVDNAILDTRNEMANFPKDLDGRIKASDPPSFLVLSNLSVADSGEYWCAVFYKGVCVSVTKTVLVEWDTFGIDSMFYRVYSSLMGCALLGMVGVLITVNLKTRRSDQASLKTRRTVAQKQRQRSSSMEEERGDSNEEIGNIKERNEEI